MTGLGAPSWETLAAIAGVVVSLATLTGAGLSYWNRSLRRDDVHRWADEAIEALQTLVLLTALPAGRVDPAEHQRRLTEVLFRTSILTERGRLFFRNKPARYGREKPPAYRGYRPAVLDSLIAAHQVALHLPGADPEQRAKLSLVAEDALRAFVSALQDEVGRDRTASPSTGRPGEEVDITRAIAGLDAKRLAARSAGRD